ncbi:hypothetical protein JCM5353_006256 [Sporobolomyces roseus]
MKQLDEQIEANKVSEGVIGNLNASNQAQETTIETLKAAARGSAKLEDVRDEIAERVKELSEENRVARGLAEAKILQEAIDAEVDGLKEKEGKMAVRQGRLEGQLETVSKELTKEKEKSLEETKRCQALEREKQQAIHKVEEEMNTRMGKLEGLLESVRGELAKEKEKSSGETKKYQALEREKQQLEVRVVQANQELDTRTTSHDRETNFVNEQLDRERGQVESINEELRREREMSSSERKKREKVEEERNQAQRRILELEHAIEGAVVRETVQTQIKGAVDHLYSKVSD